MSRWLTSRSGFTAGWRPILLVFVVAGMETAAPGEDSTPQIPEWKQQIYAKLNEAVDHDFENVTLKDVMAYLQERVGVEVIAGDGADLGQRVTLRQPKASLWFVMNRVCRWTGTTWYLDDGGIIIDESVVSISTASFLMTGNELLDSGDLNGALREYGKAGGVLPVAEGIEGPRLFAGGAGDGRHVVGER